MKLLRRVERLAAGAGARLADVGIAWSSYGSELDRDLRPGEWLAVDVTEEDAGEGAKCWRCAERVTTNPHDLGIVRDSSGGEIGRVTSRHGSLVTIEAGRPGEPPSVSIVDRGGARAARPPSGGGVSGRRRRGRR